MKTVLNQLNQYLGKILLHRSSYSDGNSLYKIISGLLHSRKQEALKQNIFLINAIPPHIRLHADQDKFFMILEKLVSLVLQYGRETQVIVYARSYDDNLIVNIKSTKTYNSYAIHYQFDELQSLVKSLGSVLEMKSVRNSETTISLRFFNKSSNDLFLNGWA